MRARAFNTFSESAKTSMQVLRKCHDLYNRRHFGPRIGITRRDVTDPRIGITRRDVTDLTDVADTGGDATTNTPDVACGKFLGEKSLATTNSSEGSNTHKQTFSLYIYIYRTYTHTHRLTHEQTCTLSLSLSLSLSHTHTHTHTFEHLSIHLSQI